MAKLDALEQAIGANVADSLTPQADTTQPASPGLPARLQGLIKAKNVANIPIAKVVADPDQPRETFDEEGLQLLAKSIKANGILQPLVARWSEAHSHYVLIAGERRWRAAQIAGLRDVPCTIVDKELGPSELLIIQITENVLRQDIPDLELARGYKRLMELCNWSAGDLSDNIHIPKSTITRKLELLDLPEPVQAHVEAGVIAPSVAAEVGRLEDKSEQVALAERVVKEKMTRGDVVAAVREKKASTRSPGQSNPREMTQSKPTAAVRPTPAQPVEIPVAGGHKVIIVANAEAPPGPEALLEILRLATDKLKAEIASTL